MRGILAWVGRDVIPHRLSMASNGNRSGGLQEHCHLLTKFPNPDFLRLHIPSPYCVHMITQTKREGGSKSFRGASLWQLRSRLPMGRASCPSVVIMDSQSVKSTESGGVCGFDGH